MSENSISPSSGGGRLDSDGGTMMSTGPLYAARRLEAVRRRGLSVAPSCPARTSRAHAAHGACSIGSACPRPPPSRRGSHRRGRSGAATGRRDPDWPLRARSPRRRARRARARRRAGSRAAQDVVVPPGRERELEPARVDHLAARLPTEQPALERVLLGAAARLADHIRAAGRALVREQALEHVDRRPERRHRRAILDLAVPAAVRELLAEQPVDERRHVHPEIRPG